MPNELFNEKPNRHEQVLVAIFPDLSSPQGGIRALKDLTADDVIQLKGAATVQKACDGISTMNVMAGDGPAVMVTGALIGGLAGLAIGPLAAATLAAGEAAFGASAGLTDRGAGLAFAEQVAHAWPDSGGDRGNDGGYSRPRRPSGVRWRNRDPARDSAREVTGRAMMPRKILRMGER